MDSKPNRILLESTCTFGTGFTTGIQRVVRNVIGESEEVARRFGVQCVPVVFRNGRFYNATNAWRRMTRHESRTDRGVLHRLARTIDRFSPRAARSYASALVRFRKLFYPKTIARNLANAYWERSGEEVSFRDTDVLLLLDQSWGLPIWPAVREARRQGCRVGAVIYDLIPIDFPQFFKDDFPAPFESWLQTTIDHADFLLAISNNVAERLQAYVGAAPCEEQVSTKPISSFRLGAVITDGAAGAPVHPRVERLFQGRRAHAAYLNVGTMEPRKNHHYLLDAFEIIWRHCPRAKLCIVGRVGWECTDVMARIEGHSQYGKSLFLFNDLSDAELHVCYREAKALVSASVVEGFGLPIVEGLHHGLRVLASDIPVHREVGGRFCSYFDLARPESLARLVLDIEQESTVQLAEGRERFEMMTWTESCRELITKILDMAVTGVTERGSVVRARCKPSVHCF